MASSTSVPVVSLRQAFKVWSTIAAMSFGGPAGQISVMHNKLVDEHNWLGEKRFLHALNYCMLLPGPEAQQLATYIGWLMNGVKGGLIAGGLFILPGFLSILILSVLYSEFGHLTIIEGLFFGLQAAVLAIIVQALFKIGARILHNPLLMGIAVLSFIAIFLFDISFPLIIVAAGTFGYLIQNTRWHALIKSAGHAPLGSKENKAAPLIGDTLPAHAQINRVWSLKIFLVFACLWLIPVLALLLVLGKQHVFSEIAVFFSKMAVVSFGGAYAVLAYVAQEGVGSYGWLSADEMLDGLGMAETTPGPLIQVVQFVGYLGGYRDAGGLSSLASGFIAAIITTWVTFAPCFLWIFVGAPYVEVLRKNQKISAALTAVTAAVVGVILNLAVWFTIHALFAETTSTKMAGLNAELPVLSSLDLPQVLLCLATICLIFVFKVKSYQVLAFSACAGMLYFFFTS